MSLKSGGHARSNRQKQTETEEMIQTEVVKSLEKKEGEILLEERVRVLETFVV